MVIVVFKVQWGLQSLMNPVRSQLGLQKCVRYGNWLNFMTNPGRIVNQKLNLDINFIPDNSPLNMVVPLPELKICLGLEVQPLISTYVDIKSRKLETVSEFFLCVGLNFG